MMRTFTLALLLCGLASGLMAQQPLQKQPDRRNGRPAQSPAAVIDGRQVPASARQAAFGRPLLGQTPPPAASKGQVDQARIRYDRGRAVFIEGHNEASRRQHAGMGPEQRALAYAAAFGQELGLRRPAEELEAVSAETDELGMVHVRLRQRHRGVPVWGGELRVHLRQGQAELLNGRCVPVPEGLSAVPALAQAQAVGHALAHVAGIDQVRALSARERQLLGYEGPQAELVVYAPPSDGKARLAWHVTVRPNLAKRWEYFVDARTGNILHHYDHTCTLGPATAQAVDLNGLSRTLQTYQYEDGTYELVDATRPMLREVGGEVEGLIITLDFLNRPLSDQQYAAVSSANNSWGDRSAVSAHANAGQVYEYFRSQHGRNSLNGDGGTIYSFVNVADDDGSGLENAFWNGAAIFYGNGASVFKPLAGSMDVAAHEFTHGVISNSANLEYQGESGAINESMADVFGVLLDPQDWLIGEEIVKNFSIFPSGALRSLEDPHNGTSNPNSPAYQPKHTDEQYQGSDDNGGVHINSGIPNHAFYRFAQQVGLAKAGKVYYRALTQYLTRSSQFVDLRLALEQAAKDLHGNASAEVTHLQNAFAAVGIGAGNPTEGPGDLDPIRGQDYILSYDVNSADPNTLYLSNTNGEGFVPLSSTKPNRRPSVSENGNLITFVDEDHRLKGLDISGTSPREFTIDNTPDWDNVAVSRDGTKLALISIYVDSSIYVYDFATQELAQFKLYNPTYTAGISTGEVLYADALEWDHSGQFLIYDAFNQLTGPGGEELDFWDVGLIRVWDNAGNRFGSGNISKLYSSLPQSVNVGNPSFSTNSPYIIAYDYVDRAENTVYLAAANLETGQVETVFESGQLHYPDYASDDRKILFNASSTSSDQVVGVIGLQADKMRPSGSASALIPDAIWGIWFTKGTRDTTTGLEDEFPAFAASLRAYPNPAREQVRVSFDLREGGPVRAGLYNAQGQLLRAWQWTSRPGTAEQDLSLEGLPASLYFLHIEAGGARGVVRLAKQ